jgi:chromosome segregation ATPase
MTTATDFTDPVLAAVERLDRRFDAIAGLSDRLARVEDQTSRLGENAVLRSDMTAAGARIEALGARIDMLSEQVAATTPALRQLESAVGELRTIGARRSEIDTLDRTLTQLASRLDAQDQGQSAQTLRLSSQMTAWLVSLLLLIVGAMVSYAMVAVR